MDANGLNGKWDTTHLWESRLILEGVGDLEGTVQEAERGQLKFHAVGKAGEGAGYEIEGGVGGRGLGETGTLR